MDSVAGHLSNALNFINKTETGNVNQQNATATAQSKTKTALPPLVLKAIWTGGAVISYLSSHISSAERTLHRIPDTELPQSQVKHNILISGHRDPVVTRFRSYNAYPPYPTEPVPLSSRHKELLGGDSKAGTQKIETLLNEHKIAFNGNIEDAVKELQKQSGNDVIKENKTFNVNELSSLFSKNGADKKKAFQDLSPNTQKLYQAVHLALVKEHMSDICEMANRPGLVNADLDGLGLNYFQVEVYDTLARGLAFSDKNLLKNLEKDQTIDIPTKNSEGKYELVKYNVERFNLSDTGGEKKGDINHQEGHPLFFLTPKDNETAPPMVVARGTLLADDGGDGAATSVRADGKKQISLKWIAGNEKLQKKMNEIHKEHGNINVCGHSLGGNIGSVLAVAFPRQINESVNISGVHTSKEVYQQWNNIHPLDRPLVTQIPVEGDIVPGGGERMIGTAVGAEELGSKGVQDSKNPTKRHLTTWNNSGDGVRYFPIDKQKEHSTKERFLSNLQVVVAGRSLQMGTKLKKYGNFFVNSDNKFPIPPTQKQALQHLKEMTQTPEKTEINENKLDKLLDESKSSNNLSVLLDRAKPRDIVHLLSNSKLQIKDIKQEDVYKLSSTDAAKMMIALHHASNVGAEEIKEFQGKLSDSQINYLKLLDKSENGLDIRAKGDEEKIGTLSFPKGPFVS